ncbi:hypothetical protein Q5M85_03445 [Paraclostridium bifermentans]|nr:hypothetical protein [Paraclostridium bifermentans]
MYSKLSIYKEKYIYKQKIQDILAKENKVQLGFEETNEDTNKLAIDEVLRYIERYSVGASVTSKNNND